MSLAHDLARGATAGAVATTAMSAVTLVASRFGVVPAEPAQIVVDRTLGTASDEAHQHRTAIAVGAHYALGIAAGAAYGVADRRWRLPRGSGPAFGLAMWASSYAGWIPALGLMPAPTSDRPARATTIAGSHLVYGVVLGRLLRRR